MVASVGFTHRTALLRTLVALPDSRRFDVLDPDAVMAADTSGCFRATARSDGRCHVVEIGGELDLASRNAMVRACTARRHRAVVVDMADLTFMDCAGYGAIANARHVLEHRGGSLLLANAVGEPARLLDLIGGSAGDVTDESCGAATHPVFVPFDVGAAVVDRPLLRLVVGAGEG